MSNNNNDNDDAIETVGEKELTEQEVFENVGLQEDSETISMQPGHIYLVLSSEKLPDDEDIPSGLDAEELSSFGLSMLSVDGGTPELTILSYGIFELMHTDPELVMSAGYDFMERKAGFANGTNELH